jgi:hypothetical protein
MAVNARIRTMPQSSFGGRVYLCSCMPFKKEILAWFLADCYFGRDDNAPAVRHCDRRKKDTREVVPRSIHV